MSLTTESIGLVALNSPDYAERARAVAPVVAAHSAEGEETGAMPPATIEALKDAGLFWMFVEPALGGGGLEPDVGLEVIEIISEADGSTGWALMASSMSTWFSSLDFPGMRRQYQAGRQPISCSTINPLGTAVPVEGGLLVTTPPIPFGSGMDAADWVGTSVRIVNAEGTPELLENGGPVIRGIRVPKADTTIYGDWDVMGMVATGSYSYGWKDRFVPNEFVADTAGLLPKPGDDYHGTGLDRVSVGAMGHGAVAAGLMRRALTEVASIVEGKKRMAYSVPVDQYPVFRKAFAEADAKFWAARDYFYRVIRDGLASTASSQTLSAEQMARIRQATTHLHSVATDVLLFASLWGGTQTVRNPSFLGRTMRDTIVARNHAYVDVVTLDNAAGPIIASWR
ncbi:acyl-CoA dehydrogenase family protein [Salinibacterium sp. ZJ454]|uniref:acyl-CoA dehydrogenase family protein n=1 Tax=Salinibacterium sp. ZJ454 TaxID=2708339 RepID=UPI001422D9B4|nr:acyl-CoA dehydrogenase family protein [Salinibacterium sp. ZJ454]